MVKLKHWCGFADILRPKTATVLEFDREFVVESGHCRATRITYPSVCPVLEDHQCRGLHVP